MAFDALFQSCLSRECGEILGRGKVEKIGQPGPLTLCVFMKTDTGTRCLAIRIGVSVPHFCVTALKEENPPTPPSFCMLLRKHLLGTRLSEVKQEGFERITRFIFDGYDELGYPCRKTLVCEMLGKYANLLLLDGNDKILAVLRPVDFSMSTVRQLLPGMVYALPPKQEGRLDPALCGKKDYRQMLESLPPDTSCASAVSGRIAGVARSSARQIVLNLLGDENALVGGNEEKLSEGLSSFFGSFQDGKGTPCRMTDENGENLDFSFMPLTYLGPSALVERYPTFGELLDGYFQSQEKESVRKNRGEDILQILRHAENRIGRKLEMQNEELAECEKGETYRLYGDLLTANLYRLKKGMSEATLENYYEDMKPVTVPLDIRLSPSANAQRYYKKYAKTKSARKHLTEQIQLGQNQLSYLSSVRESFERAESERDFEEIRQELILSGFSKAKKTDGKKKKTLSPGILVFQTTDGKKVLCGKNNLSNDEITFKRASGTDWWFHAKNRHGAHVVLLLEGGEATDLDFTEAAEIAAFHSEAKGGQVPVDY
ncbi:MAG: NFACT family protein, partial [Clostridia bacterium]|nr:NFACT family protein [Clostridia bacterium]